MSESTGYGANPNLKPVGVQIQFTQGQMTEYMKCASDPIYFIEKFMQIIHVDRGLVSFKLYEYQKAMIKIVHDNRFCISMCPRQVGKTTTYVGYFVWYSIFRPNSKLAVLAHKHSTAKEILDRIKKSYELLPKWIQQGISTWNKNSIELENGSKIVCSATTGSSCRGESYNIILLDEFAHVPGNIADEFMASVYPVVASGKTTKVIIVSTPFGMNQFYKMWVEANKKEKSNGFVPFRVYWQDIPAYKEKGWKEETIAKIGGEQFAVEFDCEFLGSSNTLISGKALTRMMFQDPVWFNEEGFYILEHVVKGRHYVLIADTSHGIGQDYSSCQVIDITEVPYKQVAVFRNNQMDAFTVPSVFYKVAQLYNNAYILVELNDLGNQVATILQNELEYENLITVISRGKGGQIAAGGFIGTGRPNLGVTMSKTVKKIGCSNLKSLIESSKLVVHDFHTIKEFSTFSKGDKDTYEAEYGQHDDMITPLICFGWLIAQPFFKDLTDVDVRKSLHSKRLEEIENGMLPIGYLSDGKQPEDKMVIVDTGSKNEVWYGQENYGVLGN